MTNSVEYLFSFLCDGNVFQIGYSKDIHPRVIIEVIYKNKLI